VLLVHKPDPQSPLTVQVAPSAHVGEHAGAAQWPAVQVTEVQSVPSRQATPTAQVGEQPGVHVTITVVTSAPLMVPFALETRHDWVGLLGSTVIATIHAVPSGCAGNVNVVAPLGIVRVAPVSVFLSCRPLPTRPVMFPPTV